MALSTGWLPPEPTPMNAQNVAIATKFGDPAPTSPAIPEIAKVTSTIVSAMLQVVSPYKRTACLLFEWKGCEREELFAKKVGTYCE